MKNQTKLVIIKLIHTVVWLVMAAASLYILYAGLFNVVSFWLWLCIALLCLESIILLINGWTCPITFIALKYTQAKDDNFDIYLPNFIAKNNKIIFGAIFVVGVILSLVNIFVRQRWFILT